MKILGVHMQSHDTSVCLVQNGKILYAATNERFSRRKMDLEAPVQALKDCLKFTKTRKEEINKVVFVGDSFPHSYLGRLKELSWPVLFTKGRYYLWWRKIHVILYQILITTGIPSFFYRELFPRFKIRKELVGFKGKYLTVHHHMAHLYAAYYTSGFKNCLVCCAEGSGFDETFSIYHVINNQWTKITQDRLPNSTGKFYELVTIILGFNVLRHPGKITGLAGYGNYKKAYKYVKDLLWTEGLNLKLNHQKYLKWRVDYERNKIFPKELKSYKREDIAAAFQKRLEECITEVIKKAIRKTGERKISLTGGVFANVKLNQKIHEISEIKDIHILQPMGDDGLVLGAALHIAHQNGFKTNRPENVYLGPNFSEKDIFSAIKKYKLKYSKEKKIEKKIAYLLSKKNVVARFNGRMEFGPRALGNRSILYQTTDPRVNDWLNKRLNRTEFMPFAPVTLKEFANKCYKNLKGAEYSSRFMTITFDCTSFMKRVSPAVVHVDGTARPQIISRKDNPSYYKILREYYKLTGIPSLINTSFNMHEEPIVCTPEDAIRSFLDGKLDYLAIGNFVLKK